MLKGKAPEREREADDAADEVGEGEECRDCVPVATTTEEPMGAARLGTPGGAAPRWVYTKGWPSQEMEAELIGKGLDETKPISQAELISLWREIKRYAFGLDGWLDDSSRPLMWLLQQVVGRGAIALTQRRR